MITQSERRVLDVLAKQGPQYNGSLGVMTGLAWDSCIFAGLARAGLISSGHPIDITEAGRKELDADELEE